MNENVPACLPGVVPSGLGRRLRRSEHPALSPTPATAPAACPCCGAVGSRRGGGTRGRCTGLDAHPRRPHSENRGGRHCRSPGRGTDRGPHPGELSRPALGGVHQRSVRRAVGHVLPPFAKPAGKDRLGDLAAHRTFIAQPAVRHCPARAARLRNQPARWGWRADLRGRSGNRFRRHSLAHQRPDAARGARHPQGDFPARAHQGGDPRSNERCAHPGVRERQAALRTGFRAQPHSLAGQHEHPRPSPRYHRGAGPTCFAGPLRADRRAAVSECPSHGQGLGRSAHRRGLQGRPERLGHRRHLPAAPGERQQAGGLRPGSAHLGPYQELGAHLGCQAKGIGGRRHFHLSGAEHPSGTDGGHPQRGARHPQRSVSRSWRGCPAPAKGRGSRVHR